jgi:hypothetical protein
VGGGCSGGVCDFGSPALGVESAALVDDLTITSNDANGFQITGYLTDVIRRRTRLRRERSVQLR